MALDRLLQNTVSPKDAAFVAVHSSDTGDLKHD